MPQPRERRAVGDVQGKKGVGAGHDLCSKQGEQRLSQ